VAGSGIARMIIQYYVVINREKGLLDRVAE